MKLPDPNEWRVVNESLANACRRIYPYAVDWRDVLAASYGMDGIVEDELLRDEIAAIDAFLAACRAGEGWPITRVVWIVGDSGSMRMNT